MIGVIHYKDKTLVVTQEDENQYNSLKTELERKGFVREIRLKRLQKVFGGGDV